MKKLLLAATVVLFSLGLSAQQNEVEMFQSVFKVEKKALLMDFLQLSDEEAQAFWPIYETYELERAEIGNKRIALIKKYAEQWQNMTEEQADALVAESFALRAQRDKLQKKYYKKMKKAVGALRAAQFVQFERFVQTQIDSELDNNMPLIGERM